MNNINKTKKFYNSINSDYIELKKNHFQINHIEEYNMKMIIKNDLNNKDILDIGCGLGYHLNFYSKKAKSTTGIDLSWKNIEFARKKSSKSLFIEGDFLSHDFIDEKFDIISASLVLDYFNNKQKQLFFKKVYNLLNKGGLFLFSHKNPVIEGLNFESTKQDDYLDIWKINKTKGYFENDKFKIKDFFGQKMIKYHTTFESFFKLALKNNFKIIDYSDCFPDKKSKMENIEEYEYYSQIPQFFILKLQK